ncbi:MAG: class I SAM-dependent methyltransferase [Lentisphaerae bacterium]|nr:class I SAM-dependent methyltransferase [Lentisphaerota bacterium]
MNTPGSLPRRLLKKLHPEGIRWGFARLYTRLSATRPFEKFYELIARDILARVPAGRVLDIGTGPARLLLKIRALAPAMHLTGVDVSPEMVARAREILAAAGVGEQIELVTANASHLPFPDGAFDAVISSGSLHHWKAPVASLNEIYRVLKPGGQALLYDLVRDTPKAEWQKTADILGRWRVLFMWLHGFEEPFYRTDGLRQLAEGSLFATGEVGFLGLVCRLALRKM